MGTTTRAPPSAAPTRRFAPRALLFRSPARPPGGSGGREPPRKAVLPKSMLPAVLVAIFKPVLLSEFLGPRQLVFLLLPISSPNGIS